MISGGRCKKTIASGTMTATSKQAEHQHGLAPAVPAIARSKIGGQMAPATYWPLEISASAEPRRRSNQRLT